MMLRCEGFLDISIPINESAPLVVTTDQSQVLVSETRENFFKDPDGDNSGEVSKFPRKSNLYHRPPVMSSTETTTSSSETLGTRPMSQVTNTPRTQPRQRYVKQRC